LRPKKDRVLARGGAAKSEPEKKSRKFRRQAGKLAKGITQKKGKTVPEKAQL